MLVIIIIGVLALVFALGALLGAPYLPTRKGDVAGALELLNLRKGQTVLDLGSGDGKFLLAAAKAGLFAIGYEINPLLFALSYLRTFKYRESIELHLADYWRVKLPEVEGIYVFLIGRYMRKLDRKLRKEIKQPTRVVSFTFLIPGRESEKKINGMYLYRYP